MVAQHSSKMEVRVNLEEKTLLIKHVLTYNNASNDTLKHIVLNDWNNAYSSKTSALAKRFSDEFSRSFHLSSEKERGKTTINAIVDDNFKNVDWERPRNSIDLIKFFRVASIFRALLE